MAIILTEDADSRADLGPSGITQQDVASFGASDYVAGGYPIYASYFGLAHIRALIPAAYSGNNANYDWKYIKPAVAGPSAQNPGYLRVMEPNGTSTTPSPVATALGSASNYALLASSGITNTGNTVIVGGNIGSSPTASISFGTGSLVPPASIDNTNAAAAQTALTAAITYYQGLTPTLSGLANLSTGGNGSTAATYTPGVYAGAAGLTMPTGIILDAQNNPNATFVFVVGTTINLASGQSIALVNGAQAANVVFVAGSAFTSVATSTVNGNVLAVSGITLGGGTLNGRALVKTGPVTISAATIVTVPVASGSSAGGPLTEVAAGTSFTGTTDLLAFGY